MDATWVEFRAGEDRSGPMAWGQRKMRGELRDHPEDRELPFVTMDLPVPDGTPPDAVMRALATLLEAHESLRTTYPDMTTQQVAGEGRLRVGLVESDDTDAAFERLCSKPFDVERELLVRAELLLDSAGAPGTLVCAFSHMAVDGLGLPVLVDQLRTLLVSPVPAEVLRTSLQPLELAARQQAGNRRAAQTMDHWASAYAAAPQETLAVPAQLQPGEGSRFCDAWIVSSAMADALAAITRRTKASASAVLLAAIAAVIGAYVGLDRCAITSISGNRASRELAEHIGTVSQDALVVVDLAGPTFDSLVRETWLRSLTAYQHSIVDSLAQRATRDAVAARQGVLFRRDFVYSDLAGEPGKPVDATKIDIQDAGFVWVRGFLAAHRLEGVAELAFCVDTHYVSRSDARMLLESLERLLVSAAEEDVPLPQDIRPVDRGPEWMRVGPSWIDLRSCQALVDDVLGAGVAEVRSEDGEVVARVPEPTDELRAACVAALPGFEAAMVPKFLAASS